MECTTGVRQHQKAIPTLDSHTPGFIIMQCGPCSCSQSHAPRRTLLVLGPIGNNHLARKSHVTTSLYPLVFLGRDEHISVDWPCRRATMARTEHVASTLMARVQTLIRGWRAISQCSHCHGSIRSDISFGQVTGTLHQHCTTVANGTRARAPQWMATWHERSLELTSRPEFDRVLSVSTWLRVER